MFLSHFHHLNFLELPAYSFILIFKYFIYVSVFIFGLFLTSLSSPCLYLSLRHLHLHLLYLYRCYLCLPYLYIYLSHLYDYSYVHLLTSSFFIFIHYLLPPLVQHQPLLRIFPSLTPSPYIFSLYVFPFPIYAFSSLIPQSVPLSKSHADFLPQPLPSHPISDSLLLFSLSFLSSLSPLSYSSPSSVISLTITRTPPPLSD